MMTLRKGEKGLKSGQGEDISTLLVFERKKGREKQA